jgi:hypothetical protein
MAENVKRQRPIQIQSDCAARVAFDLMKTIGNRDKNAKAGEESYWLTLYAKCLKAVHGRMTAR